MWDTQASDLNMVRTPAKKDLVVPFVKALRKDNLKVGLYFSLNDWSHPNYPIHTGTEKRYENDEARWECF